MESNGKQKFDANWVWGVLLIGLGAMFLIGQVLGINIAGDLVGIFIMIGIGLPFFIIYRQNPQERWWALIPTYVMWAVAGIIFLDMIRLDRFIGTYVMVAIAIPFWYIYFKNKERWWAVIPAGIMTFIGVMLLIEALWPIIPAALIIAGIYILVRQLSGGKSGGQEETKFEPLTGPKADRPKG